MDSVKVQQMIETLHNGFGFGAFSQGSSGIFCIIKIIEPEEKIYLQKKLIIFSFKN